MFKKIVIRTALFAAVLFFANYLAAYLFTNVGNDLVVAQLNDVDNALPNLRSFTKGIKYLKYIVIFAYLLSVYRVVKKK